MDAWLQQRHYPDLDPRAERALRAAGLSWHDEVEAEKRLREADELAPGHMAVVIAQYRYHLYKHRFELARRYVERCLSLSSTELHFPADHARVTRMHADFAASDPRVRFWLFALQAYGYVLLRCGEREGGMRALAKVVELDAEDQTRTRVLLSVIQRSLGELDPE